MKNCTSEKVKKKSKNFTQENMRTKLDEYFCCWAGQENKEKGK